MQMTSVEVQPFVQVGTVLYEGISGTTPCHPITSFGIHNLLDDAIYLLPGSQLWPKSCMIYKIKLFMSAALMNRMISVMDIVQTFLFHGIGKDRYKPFR